MNYFCFNIFKRQENTEMLGQMREITEQYGGIKFKREKVTKET